MLYPFPVKDLSEQFGRNPIMQNTVLLGGLLWLLDLDFDVLEGMLRETFRRKGEKVVDANVGVARAGYQYAVEHYAKRDYRWQLSGKRRDGGLRQRALWHGCLSGGMQILRGLPDDTGIVDSSLAGALWTTARHGGEAGRRRDCGDEHDGRRRTCGRARHVRHVAGVSR